ncbi:MAG: hypothetical protein NC453_15760 [Muribaculum sp.]|nr:hypothetical protein [Muribaculum sp.]
MANLNFLDKQLIEDVFGMSSGYVLDFSNRTFDEFMLEVMGESIYSKYEYMSKANLLRRFMSDYSDDFVGKMLVLAVSYMQSKGQITPENSNKVSQLLELGQSKLGKVKASHKEKPTIHSTSEYPVDYDCLAKGLMDVDAIKDVQKRGYEFERYLKKLFEAFDMDPRGSYRTDVDQIDGSFVLNGNTILLEAKYRMSDLSKNDLILFENKVSKKSSFARGLFVSLSDFEANVIDYFKDRSARFIALSVAEIYRMCEQKYDLREVLTKKYRYLDETGIIYRNINYLF